MEINLQAAGAALPQSLPGARSADTPVVVKTSDVIPTAPRVKEATVDLSAADQKRYAQLMRAAQTFFKDVYAVSDTTFAIFKDGTGQYVTRFTSLRDGRVTYIPEPQLVDYLQRTQQIRQALVEIEV